MSPAEKAFRTLREHWFNHKLRLRFHEREWEDDEHEKVWRVDNAAMKLKYDSDTEAILCGEDRPINPQCGADLLG